MQLEMILSLRWTSDLLQEWQESSNPDTCVDLMKPTGPTVERQRQTQQPHCHPHLPSSAGAKC